MIVARVGDAERVERGEDGGRRVGVVGRHGYRDGSRRRVRPQSRERHVLPASRRCYFFNWLATASAAFLIASSSPR